MAAPDLSVNSSGTDVDSSGKRNEFKRFDVVTDYSDHHYRDCEVSSKDRNKDCFQNAGSGVCKKIMEEWRILENSLPESIFVRVYEGRIDLLRAVIIGASGTPYHDGLFFFDVAFPSDYPNSPPKVYYHSHGLEMNPNLYSDGYVCLSLLNTWDGDETERWNPENSTILQVLVSLQALVLNEKPFYNEPGYAEDDGPEDGGSSWDQDSVEYNEEVFGVSCKTMMYLLQNPPKNFEVFVQDHFRARADAVLAACKAYMEGKVKVGCYKDETPSSSSSSSSPPPSRKFKESMESICPNLESAFSKNNNYVASLPN